MTHLVLMPPAGAYRVAWWSIAALVTIALLLFIRGEVAQWVREIRDAHRDVKADYPAAKAEIDAGGPRHKASRRAAAEPFPDRFSTPADFVRAHEDAGVDIFPRGPQ